MARKQKPKFEVTCVLGKHISVTVSYWRKIIKLKHPAMAGKEAQVQKTLTDADEVRQSKTDRTVRLYYRAYGTAHLCLVTKHLNGEGFIITAYFTDRIKEGTTIWTKS
jgi:hypothetical protein